MKFVLEIDSEDQHATEYPYDLIRRCCKLVAERCETADVGQLWDHNGNVCGSWSVEKPEQEETEENACGN